MTTVPTTQVTSSGVVVPAFADVQNALIAIFQGIFGSDIYIADDSQDGQFIGVIADAINDVNAALAAAYNSFSPSTAQGAGLSSIVKINGLQRQTSSSSTAIVTIVGQAGTQLNNCLVGDDLSLGSQWSIPNGTTIPVGGSVSVTATCTAQGNVNVPAGHITKILTPTAGWQTVTNAAAATPGAPVESDSALRNRQAVSTSLPALTPLAAILAAVANVAGVSDSAIYENDTGVVNLDGVPAHSIAVVAEGGSAIAIATAIADKKNPGTGTYGTTSEVIVDQAGVPNTINFFALALVTITVVVNLRALNGYVSTTGVAIQQAIAAFISGLSIGELVYVGRLFAPANLSGDVAVAATGLTQAQLDALARTFAVGSITISRASNVADTTAVGGPYASGATSITVASSTDLYIGAPIAIMMDSMAIFAAAVTSITGNVVGFTPGIPSPRSVLTGAAIFLTSDVEILFNESATAAVANVTVNAT